MEITDGKHGQWSLVRPSGQLNIECAEAFDAHCSRLLERGEKQIALDLSALTYLSSAGLRCILKLQRSLAAEDGRLALVTPSEPALLVLRISGLLDKLPVFAGSGALPA